MRAALISMVGQPREAAGGKTLAIAGKTLARRQLDFALAWGPERIVLLGERDGPEAAELRRVAERAGAKVQQIDTAHGLLGIVSAGDDLLTMAPGLLPEAPKALELLEKGAAVLVLPAAQGVAAGFERIDLERAWAGVLVVPGRLVERLAELAPDSEAASALLRIALQVRIPERRLPEPVLLEGAWAMIDDASGPAEEAAWLRRHLAPASPTRPTQWLAGQALTPAARSLFGRQRALPALWSAVALLLTGAVLAAGLGVAPLGFVLLGAGALAGDVAGGFQRLQAAPFHSRGAEAWPGSGLPAVVDAVIALCVVLSVSGDWLHRLFPAVILFGLLRVWRPSHAVGPPALAGDPVVLSLALAIAAGFGWTEPAVMALTLMLLALQAAKNRDLRG